MTNEAPVALVTGAARRIGAAIADALHQCGYRIIIHYQRSASAAQALCADLNARRPDSALSLQADLCDNADIKQLSTQALAWRGGIDALINNASSFYPTPLEQAELSHWDELIGSNLKGPYFLCQALAPNLRQRRGAIVNIADIHARQGLAEHSIYSIAKAGNMMLTRSMARELAPEVRVNGIAPGVILWPENNAAPEPETQEKTLNQIPLARMGSSEDIAALAVFFVTRAHYMTGQTVAVDGGKNLL